MRYQKPKMEIIAFDVEEVVTASGGLVINPGQGGTWEDGDDGVLDF